MEIHVHRDKKATSKKAAERAIEILNRVIREKGEANFVIATGASQFDFINYLVEDDTVDWNRTRMFHLDEYIDLPATHPASFRKYLQERFVDRIDGPGEVHFVQGDAPDPQKECDRLKEIIQQAPIDVSFVGIGENGHLAFNDPPADFEVEDPYIVVELDEECRRQQMGEGWFDSLEDVPDRAISMSIKQIMRSRHIICTVPDKRKAQAVRDCFAGDEISPDYPSSILKKHDDAHIYLDEESASLLEEV